MLNVLVIEDNPQQLKNIVNIISSQIPEVRLYSISFDGESVLELLKEAYIDIIILDLNLPGISGIDIVNYIENEKLYKYKNSIIVFSGEIKMLNVIINSKYLYSYNLKGEGYGKLINNVKLLVKEKENNNIVNKLGYKIDIELKKLNFNFSHIGTKYLREIIVEVYKVKDIFEGNLEKSIYPIIANRYNKKVNTIYCDIKQAIKSMILNNSEKNLIEYFNYSYFFKPKTNEIIFTILNKILKP